VSLTVGSADVGGEHGWRQHRILGAEGAPVAVGGRRRAGRLLQELAVPAVAAATAECLGRRRRSELGRRSNGDGNGGYGSHRRGYGAARLGLYSSAGNVESSDLAGARPT
jgi:hypothetical protein